MRTTFVILALALLGAPSSADDAPTVPQSLVDAALEAAGANRPQLEHVLDHYTRLEDPQKRTAARFLIANMPGHGYIITELRDAKGQAVPYDPLAYDDFKQALAAFEALEKKHGELEFARDRLIEDVETIRADYLIRHIDHAVAAWRSTPGAQRVGFQAFLDYVLPYRGSQEPIDDWIGPLRERYATLRQEAGADATLKALRKMLNKDVRKRLRFNERFYLHPTDQGFQEMLESGQGRCEDITNMQTYAARSMAIATAADYTPAWAHRDNNHAWNVLLDADGRGFSKGNAHAAKVYRKTFAIQHGNLAFRLPAGRKAPNRFLSNKFYVDVTDQYRETTDVNVALDPKVSAGEGFAYLCVFNGGRWVAIHWGAVEDGRVVFDRMGRKVAYLPAVFNDGQLVPAASPLIVEENGAIRSLPGTGAPGSLLAVAVSPRKVSPDTKEVTPVSYLKEAETYVLQRWADGGWQTVKEVQAGSEPLRFEGLPTDALYWMVAKESRRLERIFTIENGRQRWW